VTQADFEAVGQLFRELDEFHQRILPDVFQPMDDPVRQHERIAGFFDVDDAELFVAELAGTLVGLSTVRILSNPDPPMFKAGQRACIDNLVVSDRFRGQGIGQQLLSKVVAWARARELKYVDATVWDDNECAMSFYRSSGFQPRYHRLELSTDLRE